MGGGGKGRDYHLPLTTPSSLDFIFTTYPAHPPQGEGRGREGGRSGNFPLPNVVTVGRHYRFGWNWAPGRFSVWGWKDELGNNEWRIE